MLLRRVFLAMVLMSSLLEMVSVAWAALVSAGALATHAKREKRTRDQVILLLGVMATLLDDVWQH